MIMMSCVGIEDVNISPLVYSIISMETTFLSIRSGIKNNVVHKEVENESGSHLTLPKFYLIVMNLLW